MVRLESEDQRGVKGILIDGYMPDFSYIKEIDWEKAKKEKLSTNPKRTYTWTATALDFERTYERYLKSEREIPNVLMQTAIYSHLIGSLRDRFCPNLEKRHEFCKHNFYTGRGYHSLKHLVCRASSFKGGTQLKNSLPFFYNEVEKDETEGKRWVASLLLLNLNPELECIRFENCHQSWMAFLDFKLKQEREYKNLDSYKIAGEILLNYWIKNAIKLKYFV